MLMKKLFLPAGIRTAKVYALIMILILPIIIAMMPASIVYGMSMTPYKTYFYEPFGMYFMSPDAYVPDGIINAESLGLGEDKLKEPSDIISDKQGNIYIVDKGNNRVIILDNDYQYVKTISSFINDRNETETFNQPKGVYVTEQGMIYIADSKNYRIVVLNPDGSFKSVIGAPDSEVLPAGFIYEPSALAVDPGGRIYAISQSTNMGVIALDSDGEFEGFVGAEKVVQRLTDIFWDLITTKEQRRRTLKNVPTEYNNLTIDDKGFVYVTTSALDANNQFRAMVSNEQSSLYAPIKKLNPAGTDVLRRNGYFGPAGDLQRPRNVSKFIDVTLGEDGVYSILDSSQNKIFTYDINGNLLYAFGGYGTQEGVFNTAVSLCYHGSDLLVLDSNTGSITKFERTEYGNAIAKALNQQNQRKYTEAAETWKYVLTMNSSFNQAYSGVASSYMRIGKYQEAMDNYKTANDYMGYMKAFTEYRKGLVKGNFILIPIVAVAVIWLVTRCTKYIKKVNELGWRKQEKRSIKEELFYAYYIMFHPFDGFYDLKFEKRGGLRGAVIIFCLAIFNSVFRQAAGGYIFFGSDWRMVDIAQVLYTIGLPFALWVISNWALTTLMEGEGSMKDIFTVSSYALMPMFLLGVPATILSNIVTNNEVQFIVFMDNLALIWTLALIFFGVLVINGYTFLKNTLTSIFSIAGMGFMAFLGVVFISLVQKMISFGSTIISEIMFRV